MPKVTVVDLWRDVLRQFSRSKVETIPFWRTIAPEQAAVVICFSSRCVKGMLLPGCTDNSLQADGALARDRLHNVEQVLTLQSKPKEFPTG